LSKPCRILIVDDNRDAANSLAMLLEIKGAEVRSPTMDRPPWRRWSSKPSDIVILDIGMPGMDGLEVARRIRARPEYRQISLIAMTGLGEEADRNRSLKAGFDRHLVKPISFDALDAILYQLMSRDRSLHGAPSDLATIESHIAPLIHDLAQPLSSAGAMQWRPEPWPQGPTNDTPRLREALSGIDQQIRLAGTIMERLRETLRSPANPSTTTRARRRFLSRFGGSGQGRRTRRSGPRYNRLAFCLERRTSVPATPDARNRRRRC
jgi:CheY-like chemotaxis protein